MMLNTAADDMPRHVTLIDTKKTLSVSLMMRLRAPAPLDYDTLRRCRQFTRHAAYSNAALLLPRLRGCHAAAAA